MRKILFITLMALIALMGFASAYDYYPGRNVNMEGIWNISNASNVETSCLVLAGIRYCGSISANYVNLSYINKSQTFLGIQNFSNMNVSGSVNASFLSGKLNWSFLLNIPSYVKDWLTNAVNIDAANITSGTIDKARMPNLDNFSKSDCSNITGNTVCANFTANAITIGDARYWNASLGTANTTVDRLQANQTSQLKNITENWTKDAETIQLGNNTIYDKLLANQTAQLKNITQNETALAIIIGDGRYLNASLGTANTTVDRLQANQTVQLKNITQNETALAITIGDLRYQNASVNDTLNAGTQANNSIDQRVIQNASIVKGGDANKTLPYCGNITGAASNLCTITGAGGETDPQWAANLTNGITGLKYLNSTGSVNGSTGNFTGKVFVDSLWFSNLLWLGDGTGWLSLFGGIFNSSRINTTEINTTTLTVGIASAMLKTSASGKVMAAVAGTDYVSTENDTQFTLNRTNGMNPTGFINSTKSINGTTGNYTGRVTAGNFYLSNTIGIDDGTGYLSVMGAVLNASINTTVSMNASAINVYGKLMVWNNSAAKFNLTYFGRGCEYDNGTAVIGEYPCTQ